MTTEQVVAVLGGERTLRRKVTSPMKLIEMLREGLPYRSLESLMSTLDLSQQEAARMLSVPVRTLARRKRGRRLRATESDRVCRFARVTARAIDVLGSVEVARRWLRRPNRALGGVVPLELLDTEMGAEDVEHVLGRIEYGVYS